MGKNKIIYGGQVLIDLTADTVFQSTRPLRGATANLTNFHRQICAISTNSYRICRAF